MKRLTAIALVLLLNGCTVLHSQLSDDNLIGEYSIQLDLVIQDVCLDDRKIGGYFVRFDKDHAVICISTFDYLRVDYLWDHEARHLFESLVCIPHPVSHLMPNLKYVQ